MKKLSLQLNLNLTDDKELIKQKYDELLKVSLSKLNSSFNAYLDLRLGQFFLIIIYEDSEL